MRSFRPKGGAALPVQVEPGASVGLDSFRAGLFSGALPPGVTARDPAEAPRRFAVYRNNVIHSLSVALSRRFPVIERLVGAECFAGLARLFIESHPPESPVLLQWGGAFPGFLADCPPLAGLPYLADVARLELLRGRAYHAADAAPVRPEALMAAAADPSRLRLGLHPSVGLLVSSHAVVSIWQANQPGVPAAAIRADRPETALILRDGGDEVRVIGLQPADAAFIAQLASGATLLLAAAAAGPAHDPGPALALLLRCGAVISLEPGELP